MAKAIFATGLWICFLTTGVVCKGQETGVNGVDREKVVPVQGKDGMYRIKVGEQTMVIDARLGGRITSLLVGEENILTDDKVDSLNWGSTFWPSPQADWNWPPPPEIDNEPYTAIVQGGELKMVSGKSKAGLVVTKIFSGDAKRGAFRLQYRMTNRASAAIRVAPWEVTRVKTKGLAFFPMGEGARTGGLLALTRDIDGICWFTYKEDSLPKKGDRQIYTDGKEGWLASLNDHIVLVKQFPDIPLNGVAPKEGEVELYASPVKNGTGYVEIEHQGALSVLEPGTSAVWETVWYVRKVPADIKTEAGNQAMIQWVRNLIKKK